MRDYIHIGPVPAGESCAQVGEVDYTIKSIKECKRFIEQLKRQFGEPPTKAQLETKTFQHDFGEYKEVVCYFDDEDKDSVEYCFMIEGNSPEEWED